MKVKFKKKLTKYTTKIPTYTTSLETTYPPSFYLSPRDAKGRPIRLSS
jgi:hypothetical protein